VKSALYAFTTCEKSIASRPIVLDAGRPRAMTITQILQKNVDRLMFLTKRELEIRLGELDDLFHARTLDRIFIEERIYKRIEKETTYEGVQKTVIEGFKPFRKELRRDITLDDVERLLQIKIRRISQFDINKNREEIKNIVKEEAEVKDNLAHLRAFVVKYLKGLLKTYGKKYPRCTRIVDAFKEVDVRAITASELTIRYDKENHFVGSGLKGGDELFKCSSLDKLMIVWGDGRYKLVPPPDKFFIGQDMIYCALHDRDKLFTAVFTEPEFKFTFLKRFAFGGCIQNKDYRFAPEGASVIFFETGTPEMLYVKYKPAKGQRINQQAFNPSDVPVHGPSARGKQLTAKPIAKITTERPRGWDDAASKGLLL
jgi:topoisomerase-4 subunit A